MLALEARAVEASVVAVDGPHRGRPGAPAGDNMLITSSHHMRDVLVCEHHTWQYARNFLNFFTTTYAHNMKTTT
jgi:hypothetical protein